MIMARNHNNGRNRFLPIMVSLFLLTVLFSAIACEKVEEKPVQLSWGIPEGKELFEGAVMQPEGEELEYLEDQVLELTWHKNESYVLPFSAFSDQEVKGVRYIGAGIPKGAQLEWKDPWEVEWFPFEALPEEKVKAEIADVNGFLNVEFGPPEGADFEEGMTRLAWFRITPKEEGDFELTVQGSQITEDNEEIFMEEVTNEIEARVTVIEAP